MKARRNALPYVLVSLTTVLAAPATALAQDPPPPAPAAAAYRAPAADADDGRTAHAKMVGRFAVGFFGTRGVDLGLGDWSSGGCGTTANTAVCYPVLSGATKVEAPVIGVRYWLNERIGIDAGLGFALLSGSRDSFAANAPPTNPPLKFSQDKTSVTAFLVHGGVPLALSTAKHFTFEVIPELNVGFASGTVKDQQPPNAAGAPVPTRADLKLSGFLFDIGARVGGELHFGFIGVPELSVVGTVGMSFATRSQSVAVGGSTAKNSDTTIGTSVQATPFAIFTNNISAFYYF